LLGASSDFDTARVHSGNPCAASPDRIPTMFNDPNVYGTAQLLFRYLVNHIEYS
jgi:uncharacterized protein YdhG (YjbR/CyaY superfamily)